mmetsp:Transcript_16259/g.26821  ORF Transcript_16259/g.26821 Transcript_16259/m.26821 type:complete len:1041 (-) Transcript_16259:265-3387(-)
MDQHFFSLAQSSAIRGAAAPTVSVLSVNHGKQPLRERVLKLLADSRVGSVHDFVLMLCGLSSCVLYVYDSYQEGWPGDRELQIVLSTFFLIEYLMRVYVAEIRTEYIFSFMGLADLLSVLPVLSLAFSRKHSASFLRIFVIFRSARFFSSARMLTYGLTDVKRQLLSTVAAIFVLVFCAAGILHFIEQSSPEEQVHDAAGGKALQFHEAFYFIVVTLSTVGYGDIYATTALSRMYVVAVILTAIVVIPLETSKLVNVIIATSAYSGAYIPSKSRSHIVVGGIVKALSLKVFLHDFFHQDRGEGRHQHVVILRPVEPEPDISELIRSFRYRSRVTYIKGSFLIKEDMERAKVRQANACIVLADEFTSQPLEEDAAIVLRALAVKKFSSRTSTFVQLLRPLCPNHVVNENLDLAVCINELKMGILARSCSCAGINALLCNLFTSRTQTIFMDERGYITRSLTSSDILHNPGSSLSSSRNREYWLAEYDAGCSHEIYLVQLAETFAGMSFADAAVIMYTEFDVLLLAIEVIDRKSSKKRILVNPSTFILHTQDVAFVLAVSQDAAKLVNMYQAPESIKEWNDFGTSIRSGAATSTSGDISSFLGPMQSRMTERLLSSAIDGPWSSSTQRRMSNRKKSFYTPRSTDANISSPVPSKIGRIHSEIKGRQQSVLESGAQSLVTGNTREVWLFDQTVPKRISRDTRASERYGEPPPLPRRSGSILGTTHESEAEVFTSPPSQIELIALESEVERLVHPVHNTSQPSTSGAFQNDAGCLLRNHIVLCGSLNGVETFIKAARASHPNEAPRPILLLYPDLPDQKASHFISSTVDVYFMQGTPLSTDDLERANVRFAHVVIILADKSRVSSLVSELSDSCSIQIALNVDSLCDGRSNFVVELIDEDNMKYLEPWEVVPDLDCRLWPTYASGNIYVHSALNCLLSQAYYRGAQTVHLLELLVGVSATGYDDRPEDRCYPYQVDVPAPYVGRMYVELFLYLVMERTVMPLGLYRPKRTGGSVMPYVYTNPRSQTILQVEDKVFILSKQPFIY